MAARRNTWVTQVILPPTARCSAPITLQPSAGTCSTVQPTTVLIGLINAGSTSPGITPTITLSPPAGLTPGSSYTLAAGQTYTFTLIVSNPAGEHLNPATNTACKAYIQPHFPQKTPSGTGHQTQPVGATPILLKDPQGFTPAYLTPPWSRASPLRLDRPFHHDNIFSTRSIPIWKQGKCCAHVLVLSLNHSKLMGMLRAGGSACQTAVTVATIPPPTAVCNAAVTLNSFDGSPVTVTEAALQASIDNG